MRQFFAVVFLFSMVFGLGTHGYAESVVSTSNPGCRKASTPGDTFCCSKSYCQTCKVADNQTCAEQPPGKQTAGALSPQSGPSRGKTAPGAVGTKNIQK